MKYQFGIGKLGLVDLGLDFKWWGLAVVIGSPMSMGFMGVVQVGPLRVVYYGTDPLGLRAGVNSRNDGSGPHASRDEA